MTTIVISDNTTGADFSGTDDCDLQQTSEATNNGTDATFWSHHYDTDNHRNGLIRFTMPGVLAGTTIISATLSLWLNSGDGDQTHDVYRCLQAWVEAQATWALISTGNAWNAAGAAGSAVDIAAGPTASIAVTNTNIGAYFDITGLGADVAAWVAGTTNNGWLIRRQDYSPSPPTNRFRYSEFASSEGTDGHRPKLTINYTSAGSSAKQLTTLGVG
jgi:hypothetical protein